MRVLSSNFPTNRYLTPSAAEGLLPRLASLGIAGGSVYDALVGAAAAESGLVLLTRDVRALPVYRALQVDIEVLANS
jgi:predicted nucleic acid-binding protein